MLDIADEVPSFRRFAVQHDFNNKSAWEVWGEYVAYRDSESGSIPTAGSWILNSPEERCERLESDQFVPWRDLSSPVCNSSIHELSCE